jgi:hypothetical protein
MDKCPFTHRCNLDCPLWMECEDNLKKDEERYPLWLTSLVIFLLGLSFIWIYRFLTGW